MGNFEASHHSSMSGTEVCKTGVVYQILNDGVLVDMEVKSACAACHAKSVCISSENRQQRIHAFAMHPEQFEVGEKVQLTMRRATGAKAVRIGYLYPLIVLIVSLFLATHWLSNELLSVVVSLASTAIYYLLIWAFRNKLATKFEIEARKIG